MRAWPAISRRAGLVGVLLIAFAGRALFLTSQSLWRDEVDVLTFARQPLAELLARFTVTGENGPAYYLLMRGWIAVAGQSELALRFPAAWFGTIGVAAIVALAWRVAGPRVGLAAGALATCSPFLVWYSQDAKMYGAFLALSAVGYWLAFRLAERPRWWPAALWTLVAVVGAYIHLFAILWAASALGAAAVARRFPLRWSVWWLVAIPPLVLLVPVLRWAAPVLADPPPSAYDFVTLPNLLADLGRAMSVPDTAVVTGFVVVLALAALADSKNRRSSIALWAAIGIAVGIYYVLSLRYPVFTERYFIFLAVPFLILVAIGWSWLSISAPLLAGATALVVVGGFTAATLRQSAAPIKSNFRAASRYVDSSFQTGDRFVFVMPQSEPTFRYYFGTRGETVRVSSNTRGGSVVVPPEIERAQRVWLVLAEPELVDPKGEIVATLTSRYTVAQSASFTGVGVSLLTRSAG